MSGKNVVGVHGAWSAKLAWAFLDGLYINAAYTMARGALF